MSIEASGPVSLEEVLSVVHVLRTMCIRASDHEQTDYAILCDLTAESLDSNIESMGLADAVSND